MLEYSLIFFLVCASISALGHVVVEFIKITRPQCNNFSLNKKKIPVSDDHVDETEASLHKRLNSFQHTHYGKRLIKP